jgi:hypothetical protein
MIRICFRSGALVFLGIIRDLWATKKVGATEAASILRRYFAAVTLVSMPRIVTSRSAALYRHK